MEDISKRDVEKLAKEFGLSENQVRNIYEEEKKKIVSGAIFTDEYVPLVSFNKTRKKLGEFTKKKQKAG